MKIKNIFLPLTPLILCAFIPNPMYGAKGMGANHEKHHIKFKMKGMQNTQCKLGCYFGDKSYIIDSAQVDAKGNFSFDGDTAMPGGVYFIITQQKNYFEFIVDKEQKFSMSSDTTDFVKYMKVDGSPENQLFYDYRAYAGSLFKNFDTLSKQAKSGPNKESARKQLDSLSKLLDKYKDNFAAKHPDLLLTRIFEAAKDPDIPPLPTLPNGKKDSSFTFRYYKAHYLDNIDFTDPRMVRTPPAVFFERLKEYITKLTVQQPDSIDVAADYLIAKSRKCPDMFKFLVYYITSYYETSNIMGLDAVFVHMVKKYYTPDQAFWVSASQLEKIRERAGQLEPLLIGKKAMEIALPDTSNVMQSLDSVKARYTILYFWDYDCYHCQQETPKLIKWYDSVKGTGFEVYAVETNLADQRKWKDYVKKHNLSWINVSDVYHTSNCQYQYDVTSTPQVYILDENKNIIAKKLDIKDLDNVLKHDMEQHSKDKEDGDKH